MPEPELAPVPPRPRRLAMLGSPSEAAVALRALCAAGFEVVVAISRPDARRGRGRGSSPTPLKEAALELGVPVTDDLLAVTEPGVDLAVVVAYGRLVPTDVLAVVPMVNVHFSLLPRWRGAAPVERAILAGDEVTGVCIMRLEPELDAGPVFDEVEVAVGPTETAEELRSRLAELGADLLVRRLQEGFGPPTPQVGEITYAAKVEPSEMRVEWSSPSVEVQRLVRVGGAWTTFRSKRLKVLEVRLGRAGEGPVDAPGVGEVALGPSGVWVGTGGGSVELVTLQPEGKAPMGAAAWARGARPTPEERLGS